MVQPSETALFHKIAHPQKRALLAAYVACGRLTHAAASAKVDFRLHYYWKRTDPAYLAAWQEAQSMVGELLEEEAVRRAHEGIVRQKYYKDEVIGEEVEYSDTLLIFLLKGANPAKYREKHEIVGNAGGPLEIRVVYADVIAQAETDA